MAGIEAAGLALGAIQVILEAIRGYRRTYDHIQNFKHAEKQLSIIDAQFCVCRLNFLTECRLLLDLVLSDPTLSQEMVTNTQHHRWQDDTIEQQLTSLLQNNVSACTTIVADTMTTMHAFDTRLSKRPISMEMDESMGKFPSTRTASSGLYDTPASACQSVPAVWLCVKAESDIKVQNPCGKSGKQDTMNTFMRTLRESSSSQSAPLGHINNNSLATIGVQHPHETSNSVDICKLACVCSHFHSKLASQELQEENYLGYLRTASDSQYVFFGPSNPGGVSTPTPAVNSGETVTHELTVAATNPRSTVDDCCKILNPTIYNATLFCLGIVLLEIAHWETFERLRKGDPDEYYAAHRIVRGSPPLGPKYRKVVERCLRCDFGAGSENLEDMELQRAVWFHVVCPLEALIRDIS
ncbi:hypothetical protein GQ44DRAFT_810836 [Phaeosphaeriaceae sp. PMI808]|nr:hypothetical protein GQ44DRAFT_810836 [Phaeosphaeriaceae sp. PMI808]